jgi:general secretion pathway protein H
MPTSAAGNKPARPQAAARGFTLIELLVVVAIIAIASAGVIFAVRDSAANQLEREAQRLAALLEAGRAQSRASGVPVRWLPTPGGFRFDGAPSLPQQWLAPGVQVADPTPLLLGPEPMIAPQAVVLSSPAAPGITLRVATDGVRPFHLAGE